MSAARQRLARAAYRLLRQPSPDAAWTHALRWAQWAPPAAADEPWITLGLDPALPARHWPRSLHVSRAVGNGAGAAAGGAEDVPLRCKPAGADARAQAWVRASNGEHGFGNGTLGALVRPPGVAAPMLALTAGHVLAGSGNARALDPVPFSIGGTEIGRGRLHDWTPAFDGSGRDSALDAAMVRLDAALAAALQVQTALPLGWADTQPHEPLRLLTRGHAFAARAVGALTTFMRAGDDAALLYRMVEGVCYQVDDGTEGGDSGAAVWDAHDRLIALHTAGAPDGAAGNAVATPIRRVLSWFGVDPITRSSTSGTPAPAQPQVMLQTLPPPAATAAPVQEPGTAVDVLARTMWGEARGEGADGMTAVAHVVLNRRDAQRWWGRSIEAVCLKPFQFSCWNEGDRNRGPVLAVRGSDAAFVSALDIAGRLTAMTAPARVRTDSTSGATHYHALGLSPLPNWARQQLPCARIGRHVFYRGIA